MRSTRTELNNLLSNDKGIETLLSEFLKQKSMEQAPFQIKTKVREGMYEAGDLRTMKNEEVKIFTDKN